MSAAAQTDAPYGPAAAPVLDWLGTLDWQRRADARAICDHASGLLDRFETDVRRAGAPEATVKPARYALAVLVDQKARTLRGLSLSDWGILSARSLFDGRDMSLSRVREFQQIAARQGVDFAPLADFLTQVIEIAQSGRHAHRRTKDANWGLRIAGFGAALVLALFAYAVFLEVRFQSRLWSAFDAETAPLLDPGAALAPRLSALDAARHRVQATAASAPFRGGLSLPLVDAAARAEARYQNLVRTALPPAIAAAIEERLATTGDGLALYDALRAWSVLTAQADWTPAYLRGWLADAPQDSGLASLAAHVGALDGPDDDIHPQDAEVMDQARAFAAENPEPARAWLELRRAADVQALPPWRPDEAVPDITRVLTRRSGLPVTTPLPGLFTARGWTYARNFGVGVAVQRARDVAPVILGTAPQAQNATPDLLMDRLHAETLEAWKTWLGDLRVTPFSDRDTAILVSGLLSQDASPIANLIREVWAQSGGTDRSRSHTQQLGLAREFGPMVQYVDQGRMAEIAQVFSLLNVTLAAEDAGRARSADKLSDLQAKARSVAALSAAPRIVVQIAEDVLVQAVAGGEAQAGANPLTRGWQRGVFATCRSAVQGRYPFAEGPDASATEIAALLGPDGALTRFMQANALPLLETGESPWRWKPAARFEGLTPDSAAFFERTARITAGLFGEGGSLDQPVTLAALAERGQTRMAIGGAAAPVRASGAPAELSWPGPVPEAGVEVSFRDAADAARILHPGSWGLLRLTDALRLRPRDGGKRLLLDLRSETGRVFLEMSFAHPLNPVTVRAAMQGLECPPRL